MKTTTLKPTRMSCASIAGTVKGVLFALPGIQEVEVRYEEGVFVVTYDPAVVEPEDMVEKIGSERGIGVVVVG